MQVSSEVGQFNQAQQPAGARRLDLAAVFAQFRRDPGQPYYSIYRFLGLARDARVALKHAVFVDLQAAFLSQGADRNTVLLPVKYCNAAP
jgi:hypothetical protein